MFLMAGGMSADGSARSEAFFLPVINFDSLDSFLSRTSRHEVEARSFSLMIEAASYDDMDVLGEVDVCCFWVVCWLVEDMIWDVKLVTWCVLGRKLLRSWSVVW
jgi:hypothetical protein